MAMFMLNPRDCRREMSTGQSDNERRMRQYIGAWNDQDVDAIVDFLSPRNEQYTPALMRTVCEDWFTAFPDLTHDIRELATNGEWVLARIILCGTHEGRYKGIPPTGNEIEIADHVSSRFEAGQIIEHHATANIYGLFRQLGVTLPPEETREEENKAIVREFFTALNDRDMDAFRATMAEDFSYGTIEGPDEMVESERNWLQALDLNWDIQAMHVDGDFVTTRAIATGSHQGEFRGLEPSGKAFEVTATTVCRVEDGKIAEWWGEWNFANLLNQIDAIDSPVYGN